jgi:transposase
MRFYNDVTREIYESAYVPLQTRFASYLNGQQQFRWDVTEKIKKLEAVLTSYKEGLIPKDNIMIKRYLEMPTDPTLKDLSHAGRAMEHIKSTCAKSDELLEMLKKRNQELYNEENEVKQWAENEAEVIHGYISTMKGLKEKLVCFEDNLKFVTTSRKKKFSSSDISTYEIQRKRKRRKEQKSKNKKKNRISLVRNTRKFLSDNNFAWDAIDRICPNSYGEKSLETIKLEDLQNVPEGEHDPVILRNIAYLTLDTDEDVQEVLFNSDHSYEEDSSDSSDNCDM